MSFDFDSYLRAFNSGKDDEELAGFFTEDLILDGPMGTLNGRQAWIDTLKEVHDGVSERLTPLLVVRDGQAMMAEVEVEFTATADRPNFMHGPLRDGESIRMRFFATYQFRGAQIARLALAWWPPKAPAK